jgi:PAS domain S-box-containing protein
MNRDDHPAPPLSPDQLRLRFAELADHNRELEKFNRSLTSERQTLKKKLADCSRMVDASFTGLISLDKSGLINGVNQRAIDMLGTDRTFVLKKPISMFIAPEDQAIFYLNRSRIFSGTGDPAFEIKLKTQAGVIWSARVHAQPLETAKQQLPGMLLAVEDITPYRQAVEALQLKEYEINLLFSIIDDLTVWSAADIDEIVTYSLEKVGLVSRADRAFLCLFHDRKTRLSITHEWLSETTESPAPALMGARVKSYAGLLGQIKNGNSVAVSNLERLSQADRIAHDGFHAHGVQSFLLAPLFYGRNLLGVIGCDAVRQPLEWPPETRRLVQCIGVTIIHALIRRQAGRVPAASRASLLQLVSPSMSTDGDNILEYEGPIEIIDADEADEPAMEKDRWHFEEGEPDDPSLMMTALLKNGKTANIACKHCNRQKLLDISEIRAVGTRLKATCTCGKTMYVKVELRREHRKSVTLEGIFIRGPGDRIALKSDDWGRIQICDLSRNGIGFKAFGKPDMRVDDRFRVKFTLDNTARSVIQKQVVVRSVAKETVGCQFVGQDPCDVTLGFYMMT